MGLRYGKWAALALIWVSVGVIVGLTFAAQVPLHDLQNASKCVLLAFQACCRSEGVVYWACYGTLLGAVRDKGMIEWDDDIDVCMEDTSFSRLRPKLELFGLNVVERIPFIGNVKHKTKYVKVVFNHHDSNLLGVGDITSRMCSSVDVYLFQRQGSNFYNPNLEFSTEDTRPGMPELTFGVADTRPLQGRWITKLAEHQVTVAVPRNYELYVQNCFGETWRTRIWAMPHYQVCVVSFMATSVAFAIVLSVLVVLFLWVPQRRALEPVTASVSFRQN